MNFPENNVVHSLENFWIYNERNVVGVWFFGPKNAWLWESLVLNIKLCYRQNSTFEAFLIYFVKTG